MTQEPLIASPREYIRRKDYNARRKQQEDDFLSSATSRWKKAGASSAVTHRHASDSCEVRRGSRGRISPSRTHLGSGIQAQFAVRVRRSEGSFCTGGTRGGAISRTD